MLDNYSRVRLLTDRYQPYGARAGYQGYIIEVYDDAYEVEFSDIEGTTIAQVVVRPNEITPDEPVSEAPQLPPQETTTVISKEIEQASMPTASQRG